jgi:hypothetical protein
VDAVRPDQHVATGAMAGLELHRDAAGVLGEPGCPLAEPDDATRERAAEHPEQVRAVHLVERACGVPEVCVACELQR